jgi:hypothetical protein
MQTFQFHRNTSLAIAGLIMSAFAPTVWLGCTIDDDRKPIESSPAKRSVILDPNVDPCVNLWTGDHTDAGRVCVSIDDGIDTSKQCGAPGATGVMRINYHTKNGWELASAAVAAGKQSSDEYNSGDLPDGATDYTFEVPLCTFSVDGSSEVCGVTTHLAAQANVHSPGGGSDTQTAWGGEGGSFAVPLVCISVEVEEGDGGADGTYEGGDERTEGSETPSISSETAYATGEAGQCFSSLDAAFIDRWGWTNGPLPADPERDLEWEVYAGAGQCNIDKGTKIGDLTVRYTGSEAQLTFNALPEFEISEEHIYVGYEPLPRDKHGNYTVAPGKYSIVHDSLADTRHTVNTVHGLDGSPIYVVYHGVSSSSE